MTKPRRELSPNRRSNPITPEQLAASGRESGHQKALFCWSALTEVREQYPELAWMFAIPNGGERPKPVAAMMKAEGVKAGVPDICLPVRRGQWPMIFIELKRPATAGKRKGKSTDEQNKWINYFKEQGFGAMVCVGWEHARDTIVQYLDYGKKEQSK
jgi:hypothetical protein